MNWPGFVASIAFGLCAPMHVALAQGSDVVELAPNSPWVMDYAEDSCALRQSYGQEGSEVLLELRQFAPDGDIDFIVASADFERRRAAPRVRFAPDPALVEPRSVFFANYAGGVEGVVFSGTLWEGMETIYGPDGIVPVSPDPALRDTRERAIEGLHVTGSFARDLYLLTGPMHEPMDAMRACMGELLSQWGLDPAVQASLRSRARPTNLHAMAIAVRRAYPRQMLREGRDARVRIRLIVDPEGRVAQCRMQHGTADSSFEDSACRALTRAGRFEPAIDAEGKPVASYYSTAVVFAVN